MRAVRQTEQGIETVTVDEPDGEGVRVRVASSGICGSDLHMLAWGPKPFTLGHEIGGHTEAGAPVAVWPMVPCESCDRCAAGEPQQCRSIGSTMYGVARDGGMADTIVVDPGCVVPLPAALSPSDAAIVEPVACGLHGLHRANAQAGQRVAVIGAGAIGLGAAAAARDLGCEVDVAARHPVQVEAAERLEVGRAPEGEYDLVVEAAGSASAVASAVQLLRPGATLLLLASYWEPIEFPAFFNAKELVLVGSQTHGHHGGSRVIDEAAALVGRVPELPAALITHRFPLDQAAQAFATAADRAAGAIKVVLEP